MKIKLVALFVLFYIVLPIFSAAASENSSLLEDFSTDRSNSLGTPLFDVYNGEDPGQTRQIISGQLQVTGARAGCSGSDCGVYVHFLPYQNGYPFPQGYAQTYVRRGSFDPNANRLRFSVMCTNRILRRADGGGILQVGTYIRSHAAADIAWQGAHFYHILDPNFYANRWMQIEINRVPQHEVGQDPNINWPEDPDWTDTGNQVHYFDGLTRFYFDTQGSAWSGQTCFFDNFEFDTVTGEPDAYVSSMAATYNGLAYEVTWAGPKNTLVTYNVRYSASSMKVGGFMSGTDGGTTQNPGSAYTGVFWRSPNMAESPTGLYVAIQPQGQTNFTEVFIPNPNVVPDTQAPSVPTGLTATAVSSSQINLSWTASTDNVGVTGYQIFRGGTQIGTGAANSYSDTGLAASTSYSYTVSAFDAAGNISAQSTSVSATTLPPVDVTPPVLSSIVSSGIMTSQATITWTTDENADSTVDYGLTSSYEIGSVVNSSMATSHLLSLSGLNSNTLYHYRVKSRDGSGNLATSGDFTFTTLTPVIVPSITTHPANQTVTAGQTATFSVTASGTSPLSYQWKKNGADISGATSPSYTTSATTLSDNGSLFSCVVSNSAGSVTSNAATLTVNSPIDTTPPVISNIAVSDIGSRAATVTWTTNEPADSKVQYGTTMNYQKTKTDTLFVTSHSLRLTGLKPNKTYHFKITSKDQANNSSSSLDMTFTMG